MTTLHTPTARNKPGRARRPRRAPAKPPALIPEQLARAYEMMADSAACRAGWKVYDALAEALAWAEDFTEDNHIAQLERELHRAGLQGKNEFGEGLLWEFENLAADVEGARWVIEMLLNQIRCGLPRRPHDATRTADASARRAR